MNRHVVPGAMYGDHLPSGEWCALVPNVYVLTHLGSAGLPPGEAFGPLFVRCTNVGGFRFAGQAHDSIEPACWEWTGTWRSYPQPCCGTSPIIYDLGGVLHRSDCSIGVQGYRYVTPENVLVSGDATYGPWNGLSEYTDLGDGIWVGQWHDGFAAAVWDAPDPTKPNVGTLRLLENGDRRFIRANRSGGESVAIAMTAPEGVVLLSTTMAELRALPPLEAPEPPEPTPEPPDPIPPQPEPPEPVPEPIPEPPDPEPPMLPYPRIKDVSMQTEHGWLIGPGDKALACDADGRVTFDRTDLTDADVLEMQPQSDGRCLLRPVNRPAFCLGADATKYSPVGVCGQYYGTTNAPGNYELWSFGQWPSGTVQAVVEYIWQGADHGRHWQAAGLTWVKQQ